MTILNALLIDKLQRHADGGVDLLGLFEDMHFPSLPAAIESISLFVDIEFAGNDRGKSHALNLEIRDPEGASIHQSTIKFAVPTVSEYPRDTAQLDLTMFTPTFHRHGLHTIEIRHDDNILRSLPLRILP